MTYLGARLKYLRKSENITQQQLATALGIAKSTVSMYENGQREPDFETLEMISDYFNVDMRTFFPNSEQLPSMTTKELSEIDSIFSELTPSRQTKLLELARLYLDDQRKSEETE